jgi:hypothetical protein
MRPLIPRTNIAQANRQQAALHAALHLDYNDAALHEMKGLQTHEFDGQRFTAGFAG